MYNVGFESKIKAYPDFYTNPESMILSNASSIGPQQPTQAVTQTTTPVAPQKTTPQKSSDNTVKWMIGATALAGLIALGIAGHKGYLGEDIQKMLGGLKKTEPTTPSTSKAPSGTSGPDPKGLEGAGDDLSGRASGAGDGVPTGTGEEVAERSAGTGEGTLIGKGEEIEKPVVADTEPAITTVEPEKPVVEPPITPAETEKPLQNAEEEIKPEINQEIEQTTEPPKAPEQEAPVANETPVVEEQVSTAVEHNENSISVAEEDAQKQTTAAVEKAERQIEAEETGKIEENQVQQAEKAAAEIIPAKMEDFVPAEMLAYLKLTPEEIENLPRVSKYSCEHVIETYSNGKPKYTIYFNDELGNIIEMYDKETGNKIKYLRSGNYVEYDPKIEDRALKSVVIRDGKISCYTSYMKWDSKNRVLEKLSYEIDGKTPTHLWEYVYDPETNIKVKEIVYDGPDKNSGILYTCNYDRITGKMIN